LDKLNIALPLVAKGILPWGIEMSKLSSLQGSLEGAKDFARQIGIEVLREIYEWAGKRQEIAPYITRSFEEARAEFLVDLNRLTVKVAPPDIDTVKLMDRRTDGKGWEVWVPLNRFENVLGKDGKYGLQLRPVGRIEVRHELGHLFGEKLGIPLGESRDSIWGYNPTEWFALTFSVLDIIGRAGKGEPITADEISFVHTLTGINPLSTGHKRPLLNPFAFGYPAYRKHSPLHEANAYLDVMRRLYFYESSGRDFLARRLSSKIVKGFAPAVPFANKNKFIGNNIRKTLMKNQGTTPIGKEYMKLKMPSLTGIYPSAYFAAVHPGSRPNIKALIGVGSQDLNLVKEASPRESIKGAIEEIPVSSSSLAKKKASSTPSRLISSMEEERNVSSLVEKERTDYLPELAGSAVGKKRDYLEKIRNKLREALSNVSSQSQQGILVTFSPEKGTVEIERIKVNDLRSYINIKHIKQGQLFAGIISDNLWREIGEKGIYTAGLATCTGIGLQAKMPDDSRLVALAHIRQGQPRDNPLLPQAVFNELLEWSEKTSAENIKVGI